MVHDLGIKTHKLYINTHKKTLKKIMQTYGFADHEIIVILNLAPNNILIRIFLNIVEIEGQTKKDFLEQITFILIISRVINLAIMDADQDIIKPLILKINQLQAMMPSSLTTNYEQSLIDANWHLLSANKYLKILNRHQLYAAIGNLFAYINPKKQLNLYKYGYLLALYWSIAYEYQKPTYHNDTNLFKFKLIVNKNLSEASMQISKHYFNSLMLKTNLWVKQIKISKIINKGR